MLCFFHHRAGTYYAIAKVGGNKFLSSLDFDEFRRFQLRQEPTTNSAGSRFLTTLKSYTAGGEDDDFILSVGTLAEQKGFRNDSPRLAKGAEKGTA